MKSLEELYQEMQGQPQKKSVGSLDELYNSMTSNRGVIDYGDMKQAQMEGTSKIPEFARDVAGFMTDSPVAIAGGVRNLFGKDKTTIRNPITARDVDAIGYPEGKELGTMDTLKQAGGAALDTAATLYAPA